jgi:hypothetical protein
MSQQTKLTAERKPWVIISAFKKNVTKEDLERITPGIKNLIDAWQSHGKIMWSGAFDDNNTGMAIFEATEEEARDLYDKYHTACSGVLEHHMHQWDAMPILSFLSQ